jgi:hypothetical protein
VSPELVVHEHRAASDSPKLERAAEAAPSFANTGPRHLFRKPRTAPVMRSMALSALILSASGPRVVSAFNSINLT